MYKEKLAPIKSVLCVGFCTQDDNYDFHNCPNRRCIVQRMTEKDIKRPLYKFLQTRDGKEI